jgi:uncharacterized protein (TIGR00255 family)
MLKSMTGFGKCTATMEGKTISMEIRSLNSKQLDLNLKLPALFREKESEIRGIISRKLERGKIELTAAIDYTGNELPTSVNKPLVITYYNEIKDIAGSLGVPDNDILGMVMKMPEVFKSTRDLVTDQEWEVIQECMDNAISELNTFRLHEGKLLEQDFITRINNISNLLDNIAGFEQERDQQFREKLRAATSEFTANNTLDSNRFEQEIIYYLEKLDITEEKVRLLKHLEYFIETLKESEANGRKLAFVTQEIGREINTVGSKANNANIQRIVVQMKDELEKIKEQLANIL